MDAATKTRKAKQIEPDTHQTTCLVKTEDMPAYQIDIQDDDAIIQKAIAILASRLRNAEVFLLHPDAVRDFLRIKMGALEHEVFNVVFLNAQHGVIAIEEMFRGTLTQTAVYPREVLKRVMHHNASAILLAHNHPSGVAEPSQADKRLTETLSKALSMVDVTVLDHFIVAGVQCISFAERGLI
ncbi:MAG: DNA repair protein RadC [Ferrovum sp.]|nr:DNA repair protein RadC [Ferrovum sp.]